MALLKLPLELEKFNAGLGAPVDQSENDCQKLAPGAATKNNQKGSKL